MSRLPDWRTRLTVHIAAARRRRFAYGTHDCATFAAGAVAAVTGDDPASRNGLRYSTLRGGRTALLRRGFADPIALARREFPEIPAAFAREGDLAVVETPEGPALAVVGGAVLFAPRAPGGLGVLPLTAAITAFKV
jgi:hypothetical protein